MWRHLALVALTIVLQTLCVIAAAQAQDHDIDCDSFLKNRDGSWTVIKKVFIPVQNVRVVEGTVFRPGQTFLGEDMVERLSRACPNKQVPAPEPDEGAQAAQAPRVSLSQFADANGFIDVRRLTCAELTDTSTDEAQILLVWYSGWYHGLAKERGINLARVRYISNNIAAYCKAYPDKRLTEVMDLWLK
jgi:hypothetical protein